MHFDTEQVLNVITPVFVSLPSSGIELRSVLANRKWILHQLAASSDFVISQKINY